MTKKLSMVLGVVFIIVGILGFIPNPIVGMDKIFHTNLIHDLVHILLGVVLLVGGSKSNAGASMTLKVVALVYLLVAILGFIMGPGKLLGLVEVNSADNWLHLVLALVLFGSSMAGGNDSAAMPIQQP
jgi:preprotein translocase subunit Sss1